MPPFYAVFRTILGNRSSAATRTHPSHAYRNESKTGGARALSYGGAPGSGIRSKVRRGSASEGFEFSGMPQSKKPSESARETGRAEAPAWDGSTPGSSHNSSATHWDSFGKDDIENRHGVVVSGPGTPGSEDSEEDILPKQKLPRTGNEKVASGGQTNQAGGQRILRSTEVIITREDRVEGSEQERLEARHAF